jgi:hypothetical protein
MSTITLRSVKGSPLTNTEVDNNFSNLNTDKLESSYSGALNSLTGGSAITTVSSSTGITTGAWKATTISPLYGGTGVAQASASSTLTISGAYGTTFTVGATTSLTLPASGTLATTTGTMASGATWNGNVIGAAYGGTGVANNAANTLTFTGSYSLGLTLSANTSVTLPTSGTLLSSAAAVTAAQGGTGQTSYTTGDLLYASGSTALSKLAAGTSTYVLTANGAGVAPTWQAPASSGISTGKSIAMAMIFGF